MQKNKTEPLSYIIDKKITQNALKILNVRPEIIKLLKGNIGDKLVNISLNDIFLDLTPEAMTIKAKISKCDYSKPKSVCTVKETINKIKGNLENGKNIC